MCGDTYEHSDVANLFIYFTYFRHQRLHFSPQLLVISEIYSRFMETEDVASFVAALKAQVA